MLDAPGSNRNLSPVNVADSVLPSLWKRVGYSPGKWSASISSNSWQASSACAQKGEQGWLFVGNEFGA